MRRAPSFEKTIQIIYNTKFTKSVLRILVAISPDEKCE